VALVRAVRALLVREAEEHGQLAHLLIAGRNATLTY
jgi:hypothetical protein